MSMTEERMKKDEGKGEQDVDTGFSWIVLSGSFFIYMFVIGSLKCFGVLYTEMLEHFSEGSGKTAWIGSIAWFLTQGFAPFIVVLTRRFSLRMVSLIGGIMVGCGYFLSGFVTRMDLMYLTFTITGVGYGLSYTCAITIISFYFKKRRTLANGIMVSSGGVAVLTFPFIYRFFIDEYGLSQAFWIIGAILSNICVASCVFRQPKSLQTGQFVSLSDIDAQGCLREDNSTKVCFEKLNLKFSLFKSQRFTLLVIAITLCTSGMLNNYMLIPAHIKALGYSNTYVTIGVSILGGVELFARVLVGWFADLNIIPKIYIFIVSTFVGGAIALLSPLFDSFTFMAVYAGVIAAFPASFLALLSVLAIERVGMENFQPAIAFISLFMALVALISLPISGWLADYYGNWFPSFLFAGITLILSGVVASLEKVMIRYGMIKKHLIEKGEGNLSEKVDAVIRFQKDCEQNDEDEAMVNMLINNH